MREMPATDAIRATRATRETRARQRLPPLRIIERALRRVTERLPLELALPGPPPPLWSELEWGLAPAVAAMHGVSGLLATTPLFDRPIEWSAFLAQQHDMTSARHLRIAALLECLDEHARREGIALMPLKGAALYELGVYAPGERPMADIDLLVSERALELATRLLTALGYRDAGTTWKHRAFEPMGGGSARTALGEHVDNPIKIDLHVRIAERLPLAERDFTELVRPARHDPGLNAYPTRGALMLHVLAHTAGSMVHRGVRLIQLEDIARLSSRMTTADWEALLDAHGRHGRLWWAAAPLLLTGRYRPLAAPADVLARLTRDCPKLLRTVARRRALTDFSYSHARIDPAPGIVWVRSTQELCKYLASRVRPSAEKLAQFELLARTGPWSAASEWYQQSQRRRAWRWLTTRPTRIEAMEPVKAALAGQLGTGKGT